MPKIIELSKLISIEIDDKNNVLKWIPNWEPHDDTISVYSETMYCELNEKEFEGEYIGIWPDDGEVNTAIFIVHLFDPNIIPPPSSVKHRKSKNKTGSWRSFLFTKENFDAYFEIADSSSVDQDFEKMGNVKYSTIKMSEFLETEQANYIRGQSSPLDPRQPQYGWQRM